MSKSLNEMITITPEALAYLKEKGKLNLIIESPSFRHSGEAVAMQLPSIHAKKPTENTMMRYHHVEVEGISVYVAKNLTPPKDQDVIIDVESILKIRVLEVRGFDLDD